MFIYYCLQLGINEIREMSSLLNGIMNEGLFVDLIINEQNISENSNKFAFQIIKPSGSHK